MTLEEKLEQLPDKPGCYLHKDASGAIIYIGKAKNLRNRVRQYFQQSRDKDVKTSEMVSRIADFEYVVTDTEVEALILESTLVKRHQPRFNAMLKDDKAYPSIVLTMSEKYPRAMITRRVRKDGNLYFGPFLPASVAHRTVELVTRHFQLRNCSNEVFGSYKRQGRPCLQYHIHCCQGPCTQGLTTDEAYAAAADDVRLFLEGKAKELVKEIEQRMLAASDAMRFEEAARCRDLRHTVLQLSEQQKMMMSSESDVDIFGYYREGPRLAFQLFTMRSGRIVGRRDFYWEDLAEPFEPRAFVGDAVTQYYTSGNFVPSEVRVPVDFEGRDTLEEYLSAQRTQRVRILAPRRGPKKDLVALVEKNAKYAFEQRFRVLKPDKEKILEELKAVIGMASLPRRIESFDISNIQGSDSVASMVVAVNGEMKKSEYRKFIIKTVEGVDDFASIREVVYRRYSRLLREGKPLPDMVLIDGGKGQLAAAGSALEELGLQDHPLASIAKKEEILYVRGRTEEPIALDRHSPVLHLIQMIRDETHRFAITFHRKRRDARTLTSELLGIPGVGPKLRTRLLANLGSVRRITGATESELEPYVGEKLAKKIVEHFRASERDRAT